VKTTDGSDLLYFNHGTSVSDNPNAQNIIQIAGAENKVFSKEKSAAESKKSSKRTKKEKGSSHRRVSSPSQLPEHMNGIRLQIKLILRWVVFRTVLFQHCAK